MQRHLQQINQQLGAAIDVLQATLAQPADDNTYEYVQLIELMLKLDAIINLLTQEMNTPKH